MVFLVLSLAATARLCNELKSEKKNENKSKRKVIERFLHHSHTGSVASLGSVGTILISSPLRTRNNEKDD